jgi:hypothetical protein
MPIVIQALSLKAFVSHLELYNKHILLKDIEILAIKALK